MSNESLNPLLEPTGECLGKAAQRCSDERVEPLPGSAKKDSAYVVFEWPSNWSRDVLDGETFGPELTQQLKDKIKGKAGLQLVRKPGRGGRDVGQLHRCYLVWPQQGTTELLLMDGPERMLELDLSGPGRNDAETVEQPLVLVCTHGRRDVCCALKGRPLAAALAEEFPDGVVWESSHTKGHRFAPSIILMPWGYSFGRLNEVAAKAMVSAAFEGVLFYPGNRGRGLYGPEGQVRELAVARQLQEAGEQLRYGQLRVEEETVIHSDGRRWDVALESREVEGVVSSCGDEPKRGSIWVATSVSPAS